MERFPEAILQQEYARLASLVGDLSAQLEKLDRKEADYRQRALQKRREMERIRDDMLALDTTLPVLRQAMQSAGEMGRPEIVRQESA